MNKIMKLLLLVATLAIILIPNVAASPTISVVRQQSLTIDMNGTLIGLNKPLCVAEAPRVGIVDEVHYKIEHCPAPGEIFRVSLENRGESRVLVNVIMNPEEEKEKWRGTKVALISTQKQNISYFGGYNDTTKYNVSSFIFETFYNLSDEPLIELSYNQGENLLRTWVRNDDELVGLRFKMNLTGPTGEFETSEFSLSPGDFIIQEKTPSSDYGTYILRGNYTDQATGDVYDFERNVSFAQSPKLSPSPKVNPAGVLFWMILILGVAIVGWYIFLRKRGT